MAVGEVWKPWSKMPGCQGYSVRPALVRDMGLGLPESEAVDLG